MILFIFKVIIATLSWIIKERPLKDNTIQLPNKLDLISGEKRFDVNENESKIQNQEQ